MRSAGFIKLIEDEWYILLSVGQDGRISNPSCLMPGRNRSEVRRLIKQLQNKQLINPQLELTASGRRVLKQRREQDQCLPSQN